MVIVGGGIAGYSACQAALAASTDSKVLLITHEMSSLYSPCVLPHYLGGGIPRDKVFLSGEYDFEDKRLEVITGAMVGSIEPANKFITLNHETIFYDQLVLALGGKAISASRSSRATRCSAGAERLFGLADRDYTERVAAIFDSEGASPRSGRWSHGDS